MKMTLQQKDRQLVESKGVLHDKDVQIAKMQKLACLEPEDL